jgi:hypothetical protein
MQFRPPPGQPSSNQPGHQQPPKPQWQPSSQPLPPQQQWQQQLYAPQYQPPPIMQPPPPKKNSRKRLWLIIAAVLVVLAVACAIGLRGTNLSTTNSQQATTAPTQIPTYAEQTTSQSTHASTSTTTAENLKNVKPTHGTPTFEGQISDFFGKYGTPSTINSKDAMWLLNSDGSLSLDARDIGRGIVGYLSVSTPSSWSKQKLQAYCLGFAPHHYTLDQTSIPKNSSGLYVYDSPKGKFALYLSPGYPEYCYMNTLP